MTLDRADEIIEVLGGILEELKTRPMDPVRLFQISDELTVIETELAIKAGAGQPVRV
ncbi:MAG TPA: hypothetical protein VFL57_07105 [Bryobacteraceae bacterium]|nr:hypothetical protein [Bryobacteraceae bacterium]